MNNNYSILVNSCDAYSDAWPMFFFLLRQNWKGDMPMLYLNTESKKFIDKECVVTVLNQLASGKTIPWGQRLIEALNRIDNEYILMMLEDFYYEQPINIPLIEKSLEEMEKDSTIAHIQLIPAGEFFNAEYKSDELFPGMMRREKYGEWTMIAGPTMWRKSDLIRLTKENDTPWGWEFFGSRRTWLYGKKIYGWKNQNESPIFDYDMLHGGAIHRGAWVGYKMEELQKKFGYKLDYGRRTVIFDWMKDSQSTNKKPVSQRIFSILRNRTKAITSIIYGFYLRLKNWFYKNLCG